MMQPSALQMPVADVGLAIKWYRELFPNATVVLSDKEKPVALNIDGFLLEPVLADSKLNAARAGTLLIWQVADLNETLNTLKASGSYVYRRPKKLNETDGECVVTDPFGNLIGLRGPYSV